MQGPPSTHDPGCTLSGPRMSLSPKTSGLQQEAALSMCALLPASCHWWPMQTASPGTRATTLQDIATASVGTGSRSGSGRGLSTFQGLLNLSLVPLAAAEGHGGWQGGPTGAPEALPPGQAPPLAVCTRPADPRLRGTSSHASPLREDGGLKFRVQARARGPARHSALPDPSGKRASSNPPDALAGHKTRKGPAWPRVQTREEFQKRTAPVGKGPHRTPAPSATRQAGHTWRPPPRVPAGAIRTDRRRRPRWPPTRVRKAPACPRSH